jgi:hypothetical protein
MLRSRSTRNRTCCPGLRILGALVAFLVALTPAAWSIPNDPLPVVTSTSQHPGDDWQEDYLNQFAGEERVSQPSSLSTDRAPVLSPAVPIGVRVLAWTFTLVLR